MEKINKYYFLNKKMMANFLGILIHFIINLIRFNSLHIGIMRTSIINPNGKFYDFINDENYYISDNKLNGYSKVNFTKNGY